MSEAPSLLLKRVLRVHERNVGKLPKTLGRLPDAAFAEIRTLETVFEGKENEMRGRLHRSIREMREKVKDVCDREGLDETGEMLLMMIILHGRERIKSLGKVLDTHGNGNDRHPRLFEEAHLRPLLFFQKDIIQACRGDLKETDYDHLHSLYYVFHELLSPQWNYDGVRGILENHPAFRDNVRRLEDLTNSDLKTWKISHSKEGSCSGARARREKESEPLCGADVEIGSFENALGKRFQHSIIFKGGDTKMVEGLECSAPLDHLLKWVFHRILAYEISSEMRDLVSRGFHRFPTVVDCQRAVDIAFEKAQQSMHELIPELLQHLRFVQRTLPPPMDVENDDHQDGNARTKFEHWKRIRRGKGATPAEKRFHAMTSLSEQLSLLLQLKPDFLEALRSFYANEYGPSTMIDIALVSPELGKAYISGVGEGLKYLVSPRGDVEQLQSDSSSSDASGVHFMDRTPPTETNRLNPAAGDFWDPDFVHLGATSHTRLQGSIVDFPPGSGLLITTRGLATERNSAYLSRRAGEVDFEGFLGKVFCEHENARGVVGSLERALSSEALRHHRNDLAFACMMNPLAPQPDV